MKKIVILSLTCLFSVSVFSQQESFLLEKYREMALNYNHDLKEAEKNITVSTELENMARADLKPKLSGGANFQYTGNPMELTASLPGMAQPLSFQGQNLNYGASLSLLQPIYTGGRILESIKLAKLQNSVATSQSHFVRSAVSFQTDIQYWNSVARAEMVSIATEFVKSVSSLVNTIKERVDAGLSDPQELLMAEVKLNEAQYQLLQAQSSFKTGVMALNSLIGVELSAPTEVEQDVPAITSAASLLALTGDTRAEVKIAQDQIKIEESALKLNDSKYKPQFYVGVDGSYSSPGYNFQKDLDPNYAVYAKVSVPIFEWGKRKSQKRASTQKIGMATDNLNKVEDRVDLEIISSKVSLAQAVERVNLTASSLGKAKENEQKAIERYNEGKISILEVIDAQVYRQTSQINYAQAKVTAQGYKSELIKALNIIK